MSPPKTSIPDFSDSNTNTKIIYCSSPKTNLSNKIKVQIAHIQTFYNRNPLAHSLPNFFCKNSKPLIAPNKNLTSQTDESITKIPHTHLQHPRSDHFSHKRFQVGLHVRKIIPRRHKQFLIAQQAVEHAEIFVNHRILAGENRTR